MKQISLFLVCILSQVVSIQGQINTNNDNNTLVVKGVSILKQIPEIISATINIKSDSKEYNDCQDLIMDALQKTKSIFAEFNIGKDLIKTNEISVNEKRNLKNGEMIKDGYSGSVSLIIESNYSADFTKKLLGALKKDTLINNYSINFKLSENQKTLLRKNAISVAVEDAKEKAKTIAEASNVKLVRIKSITFRDEEYVNIWNRDKDIVKENIVSTQAYISIRGNASEEATIDLNPKEIGIQKAVQIEWTISEKL